MGDIASLNINGNVYGLKDEVARAAGGGGSGYVLKCFEFVNFNKTNKSVTVESDYGGCIYAQCRYGGQSNYLDIHGSVKVDGVNCDAGLFVSVSPGSMNNITRLYQIPFCNNIAFNINYSGQYSHTANYAVFKYVKLT